MTDSEINSDQVTLLRAMIDEAQRIVVFTGAGISTESGIPDFRGPEGVWKKRPPIDFRDFVASEEVRRKSWEQRFADVYKLTDAEPNAGHGAITTLVKAGKITHVITQNVDGLHQASGTPDELVIELHGNTSYSKCLDCEKRFENEDIKKAFLEDGTIPYCDVCGGIVKQATISFGQQMPLAEMQRAEQATLACDLFIAIGSSLVVYPAAGFPQVAKQNGARLIIINNEPTDQDYLCDLVLNQQIGPTLSAAVSF